MSFAKSLAGICFGAALVGGIAVNRSSAVQFADGTVAFEVPPQLSEFYATRNRVGDRHSTYYFTLTIPAEAGEPLETWEGVYRFEVVTRPAGAINRPQRAGTARLQIYDNDRNPILN